ncbi:hypothetical protein [Nocardioides sp. Iso805N]|uniref:hypothetical protein n=1 Tax=Nocardioides sp. Iso805N TaxID=1283287 RepID=UPI000376469A|nr:hypothetical protein [Nocardioides sp. Iso805N]
MTAVSLVGGREATEEAGEAGEPCLHRVEDDHVSGLPFVCTLDKGHDGDHSDRDGEIGCEEATEQNLESVGTRPMSSREWQEAQLREARANLAARGSLCPPWCTVSNHRPGERGGLPFVHAARSGSLEITGEDYGPVSELVLKPLLRAADYEGVGGLRRLATDALRLAEWLEAQR